MRVAIIGAGWFGCHIGLSLIKKGLDVTIFEKNTDLFQGASTFNTGRLHLGFHYPRSEKTRRQSREGYIRFTSAYPDFCEPIQNNLYLIAEKKSVLDFQTYQSILKSDQLEYQVIDPAKFGFSHMEGGLLCSEKAINPVKAAEFFGKELSKHLLLNKNITKVEAKGDHVMIDDAAFDYCVNCTYYTFNPGVLSEDVLYENIVTVLLKPTPRYSEKSFVIMDGNFFSVNPYYTTAGEYLYSLYHVKHSVVSSAPTFKEAVLAGGRLHSLFYQKQLDWKLMIDEVRYYYPTFLEELTPAGSFVSIRTKLINENANRECIVETNSRLINVLSGKINSIFEAEDKVSEMIKR